MGSATGSGGRGTVPPVGDVSAAPPDPEGMGRATGGVDFAHAPNVKAAVRRIAGATTRPVCILISL
jgi:hypothetical protein